MFNIYSLYVFISYAMSAIVFIKCTVTRYKAEVLLRKILQTHLGYYIN